MIQPLVHEDTHVSFSFVIIFLNFGLFYIYYFLGL